MVVQPRKSIQIHLGMRSWNKLRYISTLHDQFFVPLDFLWNPPNPLGKIHLTKSTLPGILQNCSMTVAEMCFTS